MRLIPVILIAFSILGCHSRNAVMSKTKFAKVYLDSLRAKYPNVNFTLDNDLVITSNYSDVDYKHHIDDDYLDYKDEPDSIGKIIGSYVASTKDQYADLKTVFINRIIPIIKPVEYLKEIDSLNKDVKSLPVNTERYNSQLVIIYAEDLKKRFAYVAEDDLKKFSISKDSLRSIATKNMLKIAAYAKPGDSGLYVVTSLSKYTAGMILSFPTWSKKFLPVDGDFIIAIPNADKLLVTGSNNKTGIIKLKTMATDLYNSGNQKISTHLYKWAGNKFEAFE